MSDCVRVSVIVPAYGADRALSRCLDGLARQTIGEDRLEVLIIQNGPATERPTSPPNLDVRWWREEQPGSYRARNRGIEQARYELLAFLDADCVPEPGWLTAGVQALSDEADLVAGRVQLTYREPGRLTPAEVYERFSAFRQARNVEKGFSVTANLFARRSLFEKVGLFRDDLLSGGDAEWGRRATAAGARLVYAPDAVVLHPARATFGALARKARRVTGGAFARYRQSHSPLGALWRTLWGSCRPPVGFVIKVLSVRDADIGVLDRANAILIKLQLQGVSFAEAIRLGFGASPTNQ